ncbi:MAG: type II toxin-antitoxin system VapC family toxin [Bryobacteraceae bacterium]
MLIDAGPIVALLDRTDAQHARAKAVAADCAPPFRTCEAVLAEAAHLLANVNAAAPAGVLALGRSGALEIALHIDQHWRAAEKAVEKYRDVPASLADGCLICCAEVHQEPRIFTFDADFTIYRWSRNRRFEIIG